MADSSILPGWAQDLLNALGGGVATNLPSAQQGSTNWLAGIGGDLASGIEAGFDQFITDIWDTIIGPAEIVLGSILILIALAFMMSGDLVSLAPLMAAL